MKICNIFSAGEHDCTPADIQNADINIAADCGYRLAAELGIKPDLLVGDFDSLDEIPDSIEYIKHPVEKDDTDTMLAVKTALAQGCDIFFLYGCTGGRLDHTLANLQTLHFIAESGARGYIAGRQCISVIRNGHLRFSESAYGTVSVFAFAGTAYGVTLSGLYYPLKNATLTPCFPLGVSNEFVGKAAEAAVKNGYITVTWQCGINAAEIY